MRSSAPRRGAPAPQVEDCAFDGGGDGDARAGEGGDDGVDLVVGADRVVVEQQHGLGAGQLRQAHRVVRRRVAPGRRAMAAPRPVCCASWISRSTPAANAERGVVVRAPSRPARDRAPMGRGRRGRRSTSARRRRGSRTCGRPCGGSRGPAPRNLRRGARRGRGSRTTSAPKAFGSDREVRRRHGPAQHVDGGVAVVLVGDAHPHLGTVVVHGAREREPLGVVPVQMAEQQGAVERLLPQQHAEAPQAGARVEQQARHTAVASEGDAGRVPAVARERVPGCRGRAPHSEHVHLHGRARRSCLAPLADGPG